MHKTYSTLSWNLRFAVPQNLGAPHIDLALIDCDIITRIRGDEARLYDKARGFCRRNQIAFFDVNLTHANAALCSN